MYVNSFARVGERARERRDHDDFFAVVRRQRACRAFTDEPVDRRRRRPVLDAATLAPSAENRQPWEFVVVRDADTRAAIGDLTRRAWEARGRAFSETPPRRRAARRRRRGRDRRHRGGAGARSSCAPTPNAASRRRSPSSIFPAVQNLLLAATALGLGSALTTITTAFAAELRAAARAARRTSCRSRSCRSASPRARSGRRAASRSPRTRIASATASPGSRR